MNERIESTSYPGPIVLFGSGETSTSGQKVFDFLFRRLPPHPRIVLLETPAGFELNSAQVIGRVDDFLKHRLQNYNPQTEIISARKRGTPFSPDDDQIAAPILHADMIFAGPGSPSYAVRQLRDSLTWQYILARHRLGATLAFSSAAVISISAQALPVYEIYKVGEDPHWKPGLDFFAPYGLPLIFIPHWNNNDGGYELDTSRCFMGRARFELILKMLPKGQIVVGIDEHTALILDCTDQCCSVMGKGRVTILKDQEHWEITTGESFSLSELMDCRIPEPTEGIPSDVWEAAWKVENQTGTGGDPVPPQDVLDLVDQRQSARARKDWVAADELRDQIASLGWQVQDTPEGPEIRKL
jgi:cyanophycinase-like exopeptidase